MHSQTCFLPHKGVNPSPAGKNQERLQAVICIIQHKKPSQSFLKKEYFL